MYPCGATRLGFVAILATPQGVAATGDSRRLFDQHPAGLVGADQQAKARILFLQHGTPDLEGLQCRRVHYRTRERSQLCGETQF